MEGRGDQNQWLASVFTSHLAISGQRQRQRPLGKYVLRLTTTEVLCVKYSACILCVIDPLSLNQHVETGSTNTKLSRFFFSSLSAWQPCKKKGQVFAEAPVV